MHNGKHELEFFHQIFFNGVLEFSALKFQKFEPLVPTFSNLDLNPLSESVYLPENGESFW